MGKYPFRPGQESQREDRRENIWPKREIKNK